MSDQARPVPKSLWSPWETSHYPGVRNPSPAPSSRRSRPSQTSPASAEVKHNKVILGNIRVDILIILSLFVFIVIMMVAVVTVDVKLVLGVQLFVHSLPCLWRVRQEAVVGARLLVWVARTASLCATLLSDPAIRMTQKMCCNFHLFFKAGARLQKLHNHVRLVQHPFHGRAAKPSNSKSSPSPAAS